MFVSIQRNIIALFHRLRLMFDDTYFKYAWNPMYLFSIHIRQRASARNKFWCSFMYEIYYASQERKERGYVRKDALRFARWKISETRRKSRVARQNIHNGRMKFRRVGSSSIRAPLPEYNSENNLVSYRPRLSQLHFGNLYSIIPFQPGMRSRPDLARLQRFRA